MAKKSQTKTKEQPITYQHVFTDDDGVVSTWHYNTKTTKNGPTKVEQHYPPGYFGEKLKKVVKKKKK
jgi:hypothetical protein